MGLVVWERGVCGALVWRIWGEKDGWVMGFGYTMLGMCRYCSYTEILADLE